MTTDGCKFLNEMENAANNGRRYLRPPHLSTEFIELPSSFAIMKRSLTRLLVAILIGGQKFISSLTCCSQRDRAPRRVGAFRHSVENCGRSHADAWKPAKCNVRAMTRRISSARVKNVSLYTVVFVSPFK